MCIVLYPNIVQIILWFSLISSLVTPRRLCVITHEVNVYRFKVTPHYLALLFEIKVNLSLEKRSLEKRRPPNSSVMQRLQIPLGLFHCLYGVSTLLLSKKEISTPSQNANCGTFMENASQLLNPPQCLRPKNKI